MAALTADNLARLYGLGLNQDQLQAVLMMMAEQSDQHERDVAARMEQTERDRKRNQAAERQRRRRFKASDPDLFEHGDDESRYIDAAITQSDADDPAQGGCVTSNDRVTRESRESHADKRNPHKENTSFVRTQEVKNVMESRARDPEPLVSQEARDMADAIAVEAGFDLEFIPPGWCGAANYLQAFLTQGYSGNQIRIAVTMTLRRFAKKGRGPPEDFSYFRNAIANICADLSAPVPKVEPRALEVINGGKSHARTRTYEDGRPRSRHLGSATDAFADLREYFTRGADEDEQAAARLDRPASGKNDGGLPQG